MKAFLEATDHMSVEQFERETGLSWQSRTRYERGDWKRVYPATRSAMREYMVNAGAREHVPVRVDERQPAMPDASALHLPSVGFLHARARTFYESRLGSYLQRGWPMASIERAAVELVASIVGAITLRAGGAGRAELTDDEQMMVLEGVAKRIEEEYGASGHPRRT